MQIFRSLGGLEISNCLTGVGSLLGREKGGKEKKRKEKKRKKVHWVISRVASQLKTKPWLLGLLGSRRIMLPLAILCGHNQTLSGIFHNLILNPSRKERTLAGRNLLNVWMYEWCISSHFALIVSNHEIIFLRFKRGTYMHATTKLVYSMWDLTKILL